MKSFAIANLLIKSVERIGNPFIFPVLALLLIGCGSSKPYTLGTVKTFDPDTARIDRPEETKQLQYWDRINNTVFHQLKKPLNLNKVGRSAGMVLGIASPREADNVNVLDEPPESSWYTYRHFYNPMTTEEIARGPNTTTGPDTSGTWVIFQGKLEGANSGFFIEDELGDRYLIKFDGYEYPELTTSAEAISTRLFYAAGYTVPEAAIIYFHPERVAIEEGVQISDVGKKRDMTMDDYRQIIKGRPHNESGKVRALASKFVNGIPVGPWGFKGTRSDDPNDRVDHEHRRELRGMRVISSWVNDTDRRDANTMSVYTDEGYIAHYVQDFGNTLGANGANIHTPIYGQAYLIDPRYMALNTISLGTKVNIWEKIEADPPFPSVGYFRADVFEPGRWVSAHPLPAYENMSLRDAYWGAKQVMSFTDDDIRTIVATGEITNPAAESYLVDVLIERRDKIGRYWFSRMNPLDKFEADSDEGRLNLGFTDLGVAGNLFDAGSTKYRYAVFLEGEMIQDWKTVDNPNARVDDLAAVSDNLAGPVVVRFKIITQRPGVDYEPVQIFVALEAKGPRIVGIHREE